MYLCEPTRGMRLFSVRARAAAACFSDPQTHTRERAALCFPSARVSAAVTCTYRAYYNAAIIRAASTPAVIRLHDS